MNTIGDNLSAVVRSDSFREADGPVLLIHGGAWDIPDSELADYRSGLEIALSCGRDSLAAREPADVVVMKVIVALEDSGSFDAGRGSVLRQDQTAVLDAGIMRGSDLAFGAIGAVRRVRNPIQ
ncbi:MAG: hypothetical protein HKN13_02660, partial [Rhodothermales bacterium]|nr:hypothetical protein [Rhodothermales bacterium]